LKAKQSETDEVECTGGGEVGIASAQAWAGICVSGQMLQTDPAGCRLLNFLKWNMALHFLSTRLLHLF
jgi:hypothetical protein